MLTSNEAVERLSDASLPFASKSTCLHFCLDAKTMLEISGEMPVIDLRVRTHQVGK